MMRVLVQVRKEAKPLLFWWLGVAATLLAVAALAQRNSGFPNFRNDLELWVAMIYAIGVLSLAAVSIGQELTNGTLPALFVQPVSRTHVLLTKLLVLVPLVLALGLIAHFVFLDRYLNPGFALRRLLVWGPAVAAIGLVPVLTVLSRKPLGGIVFALALPGLIVMVSERFYSIRDGLQTWYITWYATLILSGLGLALLFRQFATMEVAGDGSERISSRARAAVVHTETRARSWIWLSVKKELRLQQPALTLSALYVVASALVMIAQYFDPLYVGPTFYAASAVHAVFIAILPGALSSAEERRMGTLAPQILQPRAAWRQWAVKAGFTIGLSMALALGLPAILTLIHRPAEPFPINAELAVGVFLVTCAAIYASSFTANGLWALLATMPTIGAAYIVGGGLFVIVMQDLKRWFPVDFRRIWKLANPLWETDRTGYRALTAHMAWIHNLNATVPVVLAVGAVLIALYFAAKNVRTLDRSPRIIANQAAGLALYAFASALFAFAVYRISWASVG
jgi:hypothetical protein